MKNPSIAKRFSAIVTNRIMDISATIVLLTTILIGGLLLFASYLLGVHSVQISLDIQGAGHQYLQEMGYFYAINWSLNYTIFFLDERFRLGRYDPLAVQAASTALLWLLAGFLVMADGPHLGLRHRER